MSDMKSFQKAVIEGAGTAYEQITGNRPTENVVVNSDEWHKLLRAGWQVVEWWNVWQCCACGMYDSDRQDAPVWPATNHDDGYGHDSVFPDGYVLPTELLTSEVAA